MNGLLLTRLEGVGRTDFAQNACATCGRWLTDDEDAGFRRRSAAGMAVASDEQVLQTVAVYVGSCIEEQSARPSIAAKSRPVSPIDAYLQRFVKVPPPVARLLGSHRFVQSSGLSSHARRGDNFAMPGLVKRNHPRLLRRAGLASSRTLSAKQWAPCCHKVVQSTALGNSKRDLVTARKSRQVLIFRFSPVASLTTQASSSGRSKALATSDSVPMPNPSTNRPPPVRLMPRLQGEPRGATRRRAAMDRGRVSSSQSRWPEMAGVNAQVAGRTGLECRLLEELARPFVTLWTGRGAVAG